MIRRRDALRSALAAGGASLVACGDAGRSEAAPLAGTRAGTAAAGAGPAPEPVTRYRSAHRYLFQSVPQRFKPSVLPGGEAYNMDRYGPTGTYVDARTGWPWDQEGGDWIDADGVRHGPRPWAEVAANLATGEANAAAYALDVSAALRRVHADRRWCAFLLRSKAPRPIATLHHSAHPAPVIAVEYADGGRAELACRIVANAAPRQTLPMTTADKMNEPLFLEFEPPAAEVARATLKLVVVEHWMNTPNPRLELFVLDPPLNRDPVRQGVAAQAGALDEGLHKHASIIGVQRHVDGRDFSDFVDDKRGVNTASVKFFDPAIYGLGPTDRGKLPHRSLGKWIGYGPDWRLVDSRHRGDGFRPLAPGLGAIRIFMPKAPGIRDGARVGYNGTLGGNAFIFMPEPLFGRLARIFVRHYFRLGTPDGSPYAPKLSERYQVYKDTSLTAWTDAAGKFGLMPEHVTTFGGVSGTSGGGRGWQMRMSWSDCDVQQGGPDEAGIAAGLHYYDFQKNNPPGHNYTFHPASLSQRGGLGGVLYGHTWYCLETELKLNSVDRPAVLADGTPHVIDGVRQYWTPDGEVRNWVDGRLVNEQTGMVFRSLPLFDPGRFNPEHHIKPCRELGVRGLWLNWFHGGTTQNAVDRVMFVSGLAWGHEYIGPMRL